MMTESSSYVNIADQVCSRSEINLPDRVETLLVRIYKKHNRPQVNVDTRRRLSSISEELALETLRKVFNAPQVKSSLDAFIIYLLNDVTVNGSPRPSSVESPVQSPRIPGYKSCRIFQEKSLDFEAPSPPKMLKREGNGGSLHSPELLALGELEFKKAFLLLSYIPGKSLDEVISADEIRQWKDFPMVAYEAAVWNRLGWRYCSSTDRRAKLEWDSGKTHYNQCHVAPDGSHTFKGPILENTETHLHKVLGDENVLTVKFAALQKNISTYNSDHYLTYREIARSGIWIGLRRYQFFVYKDGGKEEKKKDFSTKGVKCYFICMDSTASIDMGKPYIFSGKTIQEARMHFMHVHRLPSPAKYMARFSLILSKTKTLETDMTRLTVQKIHDIPCHDQVNNVVLDKNGEPLIHSDGTGYISEDLARLCPVNIFKGKCLKSDYIQQEACAQDPPLLIQFRMFKDGCAVKGTFLLNKNLAPWTVQVRPSMIKVDQDPNLSNFSTFNSLEVVTTSNPPKRAKLSRNLVALLSYGGVPNDFFLNILCNTLEISKTKFQNKDAASKAAHKYGEMDDYNALQMITAGIPLDEPYLKHHLSILLNMKNSYLKEGRLPITESYYLMGTVDPTGVLKENEVCVILESGQISGDVLVYRNPGLHFGDIHVLKATDVVGLQEYVGNSKYGVFFPQKGPRSLGDEIAGGDFDGDMYFISRNPELLQHFKPSKEPWVSLTPPSKSNSSIKPSELSPQELEEELFDMFLKSRFDASNVIGMAADSWLAIMDRFLTVGDEKAEEKAEMREKMLKLIDIYYDALDAPKKGVKVHLPNELRPDIFPRYMERDKQFKSTSILGLIFDLVESQRTNDLTPSSEISKLPYFKDQRVSEHIMEKYRGWYEKYRTEMSQVMNTKGSNKDGIIERYKQEFYGAASFEDSKKSIGDLYSQALALYNIVYDYAVETKSVSECEFVWKVAGPVLCNLYMKEKGMVISPAVLKDLWG